MQKIIDAHIHFDQYKDLEIHEMMKELQMIHCTDLISVSTDLQSCQRNLTLAHTYPQIQPAFGFHPEQPLPSESELEELIAWMTNHKDEMVAIGEIGLPYYLAAKNPDISRARYIEILETFLIIAKQWDKPVVLHAVYEDAEFVCHLLEKHNIMNAHFHWFKGDQPTVERMITNGYYISVTPDLLYEKEIRQLVQTYPLKQMMVETDGPWPFKGPFKGKRTHPGMIHQTITEISLLKKLDLLTVYETLYENTQNFYRLRN